MNKMRVEKRKQWRSLNGSSILGPGEKRKVKFSLICRIVWQSRLTQGSKKESFLSGRAWTEKDASAVNAKKE